MDNHLRWYKSLKILVYALDLLSRQACCSKTILRYVSQLITRCWSKNRGLGTCEDTPGSPIIRPLISRWEVDRFKNSRNKSFRTFKFLTLSYQQILNFNFNFRPRPRLGALFIDRWSEGTNQINRTKITGGRFLRTRRRSQHVESG
jgi:hypothetical protein